MKKVVISALLGVSTCSIAFELRSEHLSDYDHRSLAAVTTNGDSISDVVCRNKHATAFFGFNCDGSTQANEDTSNFESSGSADSSSIASSLKSSNDGSSTSSGTAAAFLKDKSKYDVHALAIGDWGMERFLGSCCNRYRKTGEDTEEYFKDRQAQPQLAYLLSQSAEKLQPKAILNHGDNFYWNGVGPSDVVDRFETTFESVYNQASLEEVPWLSVAGNHDLGGSNFICGEGEGSWKECKTTEEMLKQLSNRFTVQANYISPTNNRWKMSGHYFVERLEDSTSGVTVDVFNLDTNAATVHGGEQICCQCYGYKFKDDEPDSIDCNDIHRGHKYCANGDDEAFDRCLNLIKEWQEESIANLARDAATSTATWKVVNTHYTPHYHMTPEEMKRWDSVMEEGNIQLYMAGHIHAEGHDFGNFNTHFVTNGAGGGIQSESMGNPPTTAKDVISPIWRGENAPYGFFELFFAEDQMKLRFVTFDDKWKFDLDPTKTVQGGAHNPHCWLIPLDGSRGNSCIE